MLPLSSKLKNLPAFLCLEEWLLQTFPMCLFPLTPWKDLYAHRATHILSLAALITSAPL